MQEKPPFFFFFSFFSPQQELQSEKCPNQWASEHRSEWMIANWGGSFSDHLIQTEGHVITFAKTLEKLLMSEKV